MDDRNNSFGTYLKVRMTAELGQGETETKTTRISKAAPEPLWKSWQKRKRKRPSKRMTKRPPWYPLTYKLWNWMKLWVTIWFVSKVMTKTSIWCTNLHKWHKLSFFGEKCFHRCDLHFGVFVSIMLTCVITNFTDIRRLSVHYGGHRVHGLNLEDLRFDFSDFDASFQSSEAQSICLPKYYVFQLYLYSY